MGLSRDGAGVAGIRLWAWSQHFRHGWLLQVIPALLGGGRKLRSSRSFVATELEANLGFCLQNKTKQRTHLLQWSQNGALPTQPSLLLWSVGFLPKNKLLSGLKRKSRPGEMLARAAGSGRAISSSLGIFFKIIPGNKLAVKPPPGECPSRQVWSQGHLWAHLGPISGLAAAQRCPLTEMCGSRQAEI